MTKRAVIWDKVAAMRHIEEILKAHDIHNLIASEEQTDDSDFMVVVSDIADELDTSLNERVDSY